MSMKMYGWSIPTKNYRIHSKALAHQKCALFGSDFVRTERWFSIIFMIISRWSPSCMWLWAIVLAVNRNTYKQRESAIERDSACVWFTFDLPFFIILINLFIDLVRVHSSHLYLHTVTIICNFFWIWFSFSHFHARFALFFVFVHSI